MDKAVIKAFGLLELLVESDRPLGITTIAERSELGKSNVHRLLQTLLTLNYVRKTDSNCYEATLRIWELGSTVVSRLSIRDQAKPYMLRLSDMCKETVHLSELDGFEVLYIDKIESKEPVRAYTKLGGRAPAYCTATGKAILSHIDKAILSDCLTDAQSFTKKTIVDVDRFAAEAKKIRKQRYAINRGEWRVDIIGIGAAIFGEQGTVIGAIGLSAPASRMRLGELEALSPKLVESAEHISIAMGCSEIQWERAGDESLAALIAKPVSKSNSVSSSNI